MAAARKLAEPRTGIMDGMVQRNMVLKGGTAQAVRREISSLAPPPAPLRAAMMLPMAPNAGLVEQQEAMAGFVTGMLHGTSSLPGSKHAAPVGALLRQWLDAGRRAGR